MPGVYAVFHKQLGDLVLLQPALEKLRRIHGGPVRLLTRSGHAPLVGLMEGVEMCRGWAWKPASTLFAFDPLRKTAWRSFFTPARKKFCVLPEAREKQWFADLVFSGVSIPGLGEEYIAEYFWRHTPGTADGEFPAPRLNSPPEAWRPRAAPPEPFLLLNPTAGWPHKCWPPKRWAGLLRGLFGSSPLPLLIVRGPQMWQHAIAEEVHAEIGAASCRLTPEISLREFLWLCSRAQAVLTVDGAASHLAAAFQVPAFTLFGPTPPAHWHRPGPIAHAVRAPAGPDGQRRMKNLTVEEAVGAARLWVQAPEVARRLSSPAACNTHFGK